MYYSSTLRNFLQYMIEDKVANALIFSWLEDCDANYFDLDIKNDKAPVTYIESKNIKQNATIYDNYTSKSRQNTKFGKFAKRVLKNSPHAVDIVDQDYITFADKASTVYRSIFSDSLGMKIIEGEEIRWAYHQENYAETRGTLGSSCMRYPYCQDFFDIYCDNPEIVKMLVKLENDLVIGRCILWFDGENKYHDRIYYNNEKTQLSMLKYLEKQGFTDIYSMYRGHIEIQFDNDITSYETYPYLDTLYYMDRNNNSLSNYSGDVELQSTEGHLEPYTCCECGEALHEDGALYCEDGEVRCEDCCTYVESLNEYYSNDDVVYDELNNEYILSDDSVELQNEYGRWITTHIESEEICVDYYGDYQMCDNVVFCEDIDDYIVISGAYKCECGTWYQSEENKCCSTDEDEENEDED